jgi:hypothetical protein
MMLAGPFDNARAASLSSEAVPADLLTIRAPAPDWFRSASRLDAAALRPRMVQLNPIPAMGNSPPGGRRLLCNDSTMATVGALLLFALGIHGQYVLSTGETSS